MGESMRMVDMTMKKMGNSVRDDLVMAHMTTARLEFKSLFMDEDVKAAHDPAYEALNCKVAMKKLLKSNEDLGALQNRAFQDHIEAARIAQSSHQPLKRSLTERAVLCDAYHLLVDGRHVRTAHNRNLDRDVFAVSKALK